jgi:hypothetical protein
MASLNRRAFLVLAALLAPVARLRAIAQRTRTPAAGPPAISVDEFLRVSQPDGTTRLDAQLAATYLNALLVAPANVPLLVQLARRPAPGPDPAAALLALERTIVEWWYTGIYTLNGERQLATHTGALMWTAMNLPAPGTCTGTFGSWSRPPGATA